MTIKAILDTNVIVSGIFWQGAPFEILKAWQKRCFLLAVSLPILNEYRRVLDEMTKKRPSPVLGSILEVIELHSESSNPFPSQEQFAVIPTMINSWRRRLPRMPTMS